MINKKILPQLVHILGRLGEIQVAIEPEPELKKLMKKKN